MEGRIRASSIGWRPTTLSGDKMLKRVLCGLIWVLISGPASALESPAPAATEDDGPVFLVSHFVPVFAEDKPNHPTLAELRAITLELGRTPGGYVAPRKGIPRVYFKLPQLEEAPTQRMHASAIRSVSQQLVNTLTQRGFDGVLVRPHSNDIEPISNRDLRRVENTSVRIVMWTDRSEAEAFDIASALPRSTDGSGYEVDEIRIEYAESHVAHPTLDTLQDHVFYLGRSSDGFVSPREGVPAVPFYMRHLRGAPRQKFHATGIRYINEQLVQALNDLGLAGVVVRPDPAQIDPETGEDLRSEDDKELTLMVWTGRLKELRTFASGGRIPADQRLNHPSHAEMRADSPLQPVSAGIQGQDLLREDELDEYVARLNRHPGRHVDVALAPASEPGGVYLDYIVTEDKPWSVYAQMNNTGTDSTTESRQRLGFVHTQVTGNDDVFRFEYLTGDFDEVHAFSGSYEAPVWGSERMRWKVYGTQSAFDASTIGFTTKKFQGDQWSAGGELIANIFQHGSLFVDLLGGARYQNIHVDNPLALADAEESFLIPYLGVILEEQKEASSLFADVRLESSISSINVKDSTKGGGLGRSKPNDKWTLVRFNSSFSTFIDTWLGAAADGSPDTQRKIHEMALMLRGQYAFGNRLIPQEQRTAGGFYTVRGYEQSVTAGDSVAIGTAEYRFHLPRVFDVRPVPAIIPVLGSFRLARQHPMGQPDWDLIMRTFVDAARVVQSDRQRFEKNQTLLGTGLGMELRVRRNLSSRLDLGFAMLDDRRLGVSTGDARLHFSVTGMY